MQTNQTEKKCCDMQVPQSDGKKIWCSSCNTTLGYVDIPHKENNCAELVKQYEHRDTGMISFFYTEEDIKEAILEERQRIVNEIEEKRIECNLDEFYLEKVISIINKQE